MPLKVPRWHADHTTLDMGVCEKSISINYYDHMAANISSTPPRRRSSTPKVTLYESTFYDLFRWTAQEAD